MKVLICNAGSTSLKFQLFDMPSETVFAQGKIERIGSDSDSIFQYKNALTNQSIKQEKVSVPDYRTGIERFLQELISGPLSVLSSVDEIERVGFKTVLSKDHYGVHELDQDTVAGMQEWYPIAPAHNGPYLEAVATMRRFFPTQVFVGAFETAFHQTIPLERRLYGTPYQWFEEYGIQKLGYHGASHSYVASVLNEKRTHYKAVSCHLGGSASLCAIQDGKSVDTSFGMSLQTGLIHANRTGDLDWGILEFLKMQGLTEEEINLGLTKKGGLLGISGVSNDVRYIEQAMNEGNERARLALEVFVSGIVHYIGAFSAQMGGLDYLVFTGGIGENSATVRRMVCRTLGYLGIQFSEDRNAANASCITEDGSPAQVLVVPANEEIIVARHTYQYEC